MTIAKPESRTTLDPAPPPNIDKPAAVECRSRAFFEAAAYLAIRRLTDPVEVEKALKLHRELSPIEAAQLFDLFSTQITFPVTDRAITPSVDPAIFDREVHR